MGGASGWYSQGGRVGVLGALAAAGGLAVRLPLGVGRARRWLGAQAEGGVARRYRRGRAGGGVGLGSRMTRVVFCAREVAATQGCAQGFACTVERR